MVGGGEKGKGKGAAGKVPKKGAQWNRKCEAKVFSRCVETMSHDVIAQFS